MSQNQTSLQAFVFITIEPGLVQQACRYIGRLKTVQEVHMAFGPYDAIVRLRAKDLKELGRLVEREIQPIPGVLKTLTCLAVAPSEEQPLESLQATSPDAGKAGEDILRKDRISNDADNGREGEA